MSGAAEARPTHHERAMQAIRSIERHALNLACNPRRPAEQRNTDLRIIERQLAVLVLAVEAAYRSSGP